MKEGINVSLLAYFAESTDKISGDLKERVLHQEEDFNQSVLSTLKIEEKRKAEISFLGSLFQGKLAQIVKENKASIPPDIDCVKKYASFEPIDDFTLDLNLNSGEDPNRLDSIYPLLTKQNLRNILDQINQMLELYDADEDIPFISHFTIKSFIEFALFLKVQHGMVLKQSMRINKKLVMNIEAYCVELLSYCWLNGDEAGLKKALEAIDGE